MNNSIKKDMQKMFRWFEQHGGPDKPDPPSADKDKKAARRLFWRKVVYWLFLIGFAILIYNTLHPDR